MDRKDFDRPEYGSYEEVHEKLVAAMQEACMNDTTRDYKTPDLDMSFIYEETARKPHKKSGFNRLSTVVAIIVIMLLGLNAVLLISDSNEAYSEKGLLHRIYEGTRGIFTDEDPSKFVEVDDMGEEFIITDMDDIDKAKAFWPELCVPGYVPEGYELDELKLDKNIKGTYSAIYHFAMNESVLTVVVLENDGIDKYLAKNTKELFDEFDRTINYYRDDAYNRNTVDIYFENTMVYIYGDIEQKEMMEIANSLN